jgi:glucosamine--fructose-6-phosphate aminotransferase (isomerizing)
MTDAETAIRTELREAPEVVRRQRRSLAEPLAELVSLLRKKPVRLVLTCARGSSGHAATYAKHLIERHLGIPVAAAAPSIVTLYGQRLRVRDQLVLAISQSGQSDDIVECAAMARTEGALTVAIVNDTRSTLAQACEFVLPMGAGQELSIAATKTFIATLGVLLSLTSSWAETCELSQALDELPDRLVAAVDADWSQALPEFAQSESLATIGRGPTLAIAREAALKLKEICNLHAEAFSGAEFMHGPVSLVSTRYPVLLFMPTDAAAPSLQALAGDLRRKGASVWTTEQGNGSIGRLPVPTPGHSDIDAVCLIQSFYALAIRIAERRGIDVERPRHLQKVTRTR